MLTCGRALSGRMHALPDQASLARLDLEYVDLLFCHRPDTTTPIEETVRAMNWIIDQGYTFYWCARAAAPAVVHGRLLWRPHPDSKTD